MRRIFAFLSCLIAVPAMAADDACTKPREFTTDKRCYVTDEQKTQKPFNATVSVAPLGGSHPYCTGTIVKGYKEDKDTVYVYTAKRCTGNNKPAELLDIKLQSGEGYVVKFARAGEYDMSNDTKYEGDYALYKFYGADIPYTKVSGKWGVGGIWPLSARVVGYGALKIMSDAEIETFQNKYKSFLKSMGQNTDVDFVKGGVNMNGAYGKQFVEHLAGNEYTYYRDLFNNEELKVSECLYLSTGAQYYCQSWGGNSGGGIFDSNGNLMGILTRGNSIIGGARHAGSEGSDGTSDEPWRRQSSVPIAFE